MHTRMDVELLDYVNADLKWNIVKKGRRSMTRRPRKPGADSFELGNNPAGFEAKKQSGTNILAEHFAEKVIDTPLKKRRLLLQSPSPPQTPCLNGEGDWSLEPQTSSIHHEDSGKRSRSNSLSLSHKTKSKTGPRNSNILNLTKKEVSQPDDFSGIELLAAAACSSFIHDNEDHSEDFSVSKEQTAQGVNSCTVDIKEAIISTELGGSSIRDAMVPDRRTPHDNGKEEGEKKVAPLKGLRLHWDLNTVMDEWEEPSTSLLVEPLSHKHCSEGVNLNLEGYESKCAEVEPRSHQLSAKHDAAISVAPHIENSNGDSCGKTYELIDDLACSPELMGTKITSKTSDGESSASKSDVDLLIHPDKYEDFSTSTTSVLREQTIVKDESDTIHPNHKDTMSKSDRQPVSGEVVQGGCPSPKLCKSYCDNKVTSEDPLSECCGSDVTQDDHGHMADGETKDIVQIGYDSPFEDGELREPIGWEENEVLEKETVYYVSDNIYKTDFGTIENSSPEKIEVSCEHHETMEDQSPSLVKESVHNNIEQGAQADTFERAHSSFGCKASWCELNVEENDCGSEKDLSRRKNGNLLHIDESVSIDVCTNGAYVRQSRSSNIGDSYSRSGRDLGPEKSTGRDKVSFQDSFRNDVSGPCADSSTRVWDSKSGNEYRRPKYVTGDPVARSGGCRSLDTNQSRNYSPRGAYMTQNRRPSPSERNNSYGINRRSPVRSLSRERDRYRGVAGFHPQGLRRAPEDEFHDAKPYYLERKVRCFSPNFNRPVRRSRSRSRSGSPIAWHFQKRRNFDTRQSPDHEPRFLAEKGPFQKPRNSGDREAGFDGRRVMDGQFRDKRQSAAAITRRNQRFESIGYPERLKTDHFRFTQRSGRFLQPTGPVREHKYKDNGDAIRKHDGPYEKVNRVGRSNDAGGVRRFRYAVDDSFESRNRRNLDSFPRDARNEHSCFKEATAMVIPESKSEEKGAGSGSRFSHA